MGLKPNPTGRGGQARQALAVGAAWGGSFVLVTAAGGWAARGAMLGVAYAVQMAPYVWSAFRVGRPTGIAPHTWAMNLLEAALWGIYGLAHADTPIVRYAVIETVSSAAILVRRLHAGRVARPTPALVVRPPAG